VQRGELPQSSLGSFINFIHLLAEFYRAGKCRHAVADTRHETQQANPRAAAMLDSGLAARIQHLPSELSEANVNASQ